MTAIRLVGLFLMLNSLSFAQTVVVSCQHPNPQAYDFHFDVIGFEIIFDVNNPNNQRLVAKLYHSSFANSPFAQLPSIETFDHEQVEEMIKYKKIRLGFEDKKNHAHWFSATIENNYAYTKYRGRLVRNYQCQWPESNQPQ